MSKLIKEYKKEILIGLLYWNGIGLISGSIESITNREGHMERQSDNTYKNVSDGNGCVYKSIIALTNIGHIVGCELLRARWEIGK